MTKIDDAKVQMQVASMVDAAARNVAAAQTNAFGQQMSDQMNNQRSTIADQLRLQGVLTGREWWQENLTQAYKDAKNDLWKESDRGRPKDFSMNIFGKNYTEKEIIQIVARYEQTKPQVDGKPDLQITPPPRPKADGNTSNDGVNLMIDQKTLDELKTFDRQREEYRTARSIHRTWALTFAAIAAAVTYVTWAINHVHSVALVLP